MSFDPESKFDWEMWVKNHAHIGAAALVLQWLERHDPEEEVWQAREKLVELVLDAWKGL